MEEGRVIHPTAVVNELMEHAMKREMLEPPRFFFIVASDAPGHGSGMLAFRHNANTTQDLISALQEFVNKLKAGEGRAMLSLVPSPDASP